MEYRVVFHPKAEAELEQLYDDVADRASPLIAWNFIAGIRDHCLGLSTFPRRGTERVEIMPGLRIIGDRAPSALLCGRGRAGLGPGHLLRRPEHHGGIAGRPALKRCSGRRRGRSRHVRQTISARWHAVAAERWRLRRSDPTAECRSQFQPSQLTNFSPVDISTRNRKNMTKCC